MRLSTFLTVLGATLTSAGPILHAVGGAENMAEAAVEARAERSSQAIKPTSAGAGGSTQTQASNKEPVPPADALTVGWVTPGSKAFIDISVYHHNVHRANHSAPFVTWNNTLGQWAQRKANTCQYNENSLPGWGSVGMNIAGGTYGSPKNLPNPSGMITGLWYNSELENYPRYGVGNPNYNNFENWGHFSQVVWPTSHQIGCGLQQCDGSWFGLCLYYPAGNWDGEFNIIHRPEGYRVVYPNGQTKM